MKKQSLPPQRPLRFLRWFCRDDYLEEIEGNLLELYERQYEASPTKARQQFAWNVLRHFHPAFIRSFKIHYTQNHRAMLRHNFLLTFRNFQRYKSTFLINLIGLSSGLACALLIFLWVQDELSVDKFHENDARLYQVMLNAETPSGIRTLEQTPDPLAQLLTEEMPEVTYVAPVFPPSTHSFHGVLSINNAHINADAKYVGRDYFNIFSYYLIQGDKNQVLKDLNAVVISDELAIKLFNTTDDVLGKILTWEQGEFSGSYLISGIFEKPPTNSSVQLDIVFNYALYQNKHPELTEWDYNMPSTYVVLKEHTKPGTFTDKITNLIKARAPESGNTLFLQKYSDQHLYGNYENGIVAGGRITYVRLFSIVAIFILLIACINFMNLSTARASSRYKEVGIKKSVGAYRSTLVIQYLGESLLIASVSLVASILLVALFLPQFNQVTEKQLSLSFDPILLLSLLGITLFTGLVAGSYPALYLSGFNPVSILKGKTSTSSASLSVRKGLVVFQFAISVVLIVSVLVVYQQMEYVQAKNLGYEKDNVITFSGDRLQGESLKTFLNEMKKIPGVVNTSAMKGDMTSSNHNHTTGLSWEGYVPGKEVEFTDLGIDFNFFETLGIEMAEGRSFSQNFSSESSKIVLNQAAIKSMGLRDPVGQTINLWGENKQIIGIVKDFHFESLYTEVKPCFFRLVPNAMNVLVKINSGTEKETLAQLQNFYQDYKGTSLEYQFLDEAYQTLYASEQRVSTLSRYFAGIAILISCLGLFGLAAFTAERRLKEIGIRKALGASDLSIVRLLSGDFTKMVLLAIAIALPVSYFLAARWLESFAFRIDLAWWYFAGAGLLALLIAWFTVGLQTVRAARVNPVECLRDE